MDRKIEFNPVEYVKTLKKSKNKESFLLTFAYLISWGISIDENGNGKEIQRIVDVRIYFLENQEIGACYLNQNGERVFYIHAIEDNKTGQWSTHS